MILMNEKNLINLRKGIFSYLCCKIKNTFVRFHDCMLVLSNFLQFITLSFNHLVWDVINSNFRLYLGRYLCLLFIQLLLLCIHKALVCADKFVEPTKNLQVTKSPWRKFGQWENASRSGYIRNLMEYRPNLSKHILQYNSVEHLFFISLVHNSRQQTNRNSC